MIIILTYQDLLEVGERDEYKMEFVRKVINDHKASELYKTAVIAWDYYKHRNTTITNYQKLLYTVTGKAVPDNISANFKMASKFFHRFVTQQNQYLLGNGVTWEDETTADKLGTKKRTFDNQLQKAGKYALIGGVSFGFWNMDHVDVFRVTEFAPLKDEENGSLRAGVRFWQIADNKPLRATLYEEDGYTDYIWNKRDSDERGEVLHEKRPYILDIQSTEADGDEIVDGRNYPSFPIVPLYANDSKQSELTGLREQIDCYDLIKSGFANTVDEASLIYWTLQNAGGMDDIDLAQFVERIKTLHAATTDDGVTAEPHTLEPPYQSRETLLDRLRSDLYEDAMILDTHSIVGGSNTATQIKASYEPLDDKCDDYEYQVLEFVNNILELAGIEDEATFTRTKIVNVAEEIEVLLQSAQYLGGDYVTKKILTLLGDGDKADDMLEEMAQNELDRFTGENVNE